MLVAGALLGSGDFVLALYINQRRLSAIAMCFIYRSPNEVRDMEFKAAVLRQNQLMRIEKRVRKASVEIEAVCVCANAICVA